MNQRSEIVKEILSKPPSFLIKWGSTVVLTGILVLLLTGFFLKYPDEINAKVSINSTNPPREVPTRKSGQIERLLVQEMDIVQRGQILGVIKNEADFEQILELESKLKEIEDLAIGNLANIQLEDNLDLGEIQVEYENMLQLIQDLNEAGNKTLTSKSVGILQERIQSIELKQARARNDRSEASIELQKYEVKNNITNAEREIINKLKRKIDSYGRVILDFDGQIEGLRADILDKNLGSKQASQRKIEDFRGALNLLQDKIGRWKYKNLLVAPAEGRVVFLEVYDEQQYVQAGEAAIAIKPASGKIYARGKIKEEGSGKVQEGQEVIIKLSGYPFQEFGLLKGRIAKVFVMPKTKQTVVDIELPNGLKTSKNRELKFENEMEGRASIHTENKRFIVWLFEQFL